MAQALCLVLLASAAVLLTPAQAHAVADVTTRALTFNAQGGTRWDHIQSALTKESDVLALQEVNTPPRGYEAHELLNNRGDAAKTATGLPSLKYALSIGGWGDAGRGEPGEPRRKGTLVYLNILDKEYWGSGGADDDEVDPDAQRNSAKSMAVWLRNPLAGPDDIKVITAVDGGPNPNKWIRSRPALGVRVGGTWYFDIHAASIRSGDTPNPHSVALINTINQQMAGQPWRALGDFNSNAWTFRQGWPATYYASGNGQPDGYPVATQLSGFPLDFMVSSEPLTNLAVSVNSKNGGSDHWPVRFAPVAVPVCDLNWSAPTVYQQFARASRSLAAAPPGTCGNPGAVVSMGDSYISGEAGRWAGNANSYADGSAWGTDRAAFDCNADESKCGHDPERVYAGTSYVCDRSDSAEIHGAELARFPGAKRFNIACSGATTAHVTSEPFKGQRPQVEALREIAGNHEVGLIVLSIGGNDLKFAEILQECAKAYLYPSVNNHGCRAAKEQGFAEGLGTTKANVIKSLDAIRTTMRAAGQGDDSYRIVLQSYPNPLPASGDYRYPEKSAKPFGRYADGGCPFLDQDSDWARDSVIPRISTMLSEAAGQAKVSFLDLQKAFAGHELCGKAAQQADSSHTLARPLAAERAEWVRWVPYLFEGTKDVGWPAQGHQQEGIHPNYYGQRALSACLSKAVAELDDTTPVTSVCAGRPGGSPDALDDASQVFAKGNRRGPVGGLPDWSGAGYRGGERLPGSSARTQDPRCRISPSDLKSKYGVSPDDGADDTAGLQKAIDHIRTDCTPGANRGRLSVIELPAGELNVSKQLSVDASYLVIRGQGAASRLVFSPDSATAYDTLDEKGARWDQSSMTYKCPGKVGEIIGTGGWIWPGRGLFRVQTREVSAKHLRMCGDISKVPENRRDIFEGSVNQHWESGVELSGSSADANYSARQGDKVIRLKAGTNMSVFKPGGFLWVGAANSLKFYQSQQIDTAANAGRLENLHMRQQVFNISSVDAAGGTVTIDKPLEFDLPVNSTSDGSPPLEDGTKGPYPSKVTPLKMITDVGFEDFSFTQKLDGMPKLGGGRYQADPQCEASKPNCPVHNYGNIAPEYAMHGIVFKWAANSWVRGVRGDMVGSHPVVTEVAKNLQIENNRFDGAWNKGKGGNGYMRGSRVWDSLYASNTTRNLRHFTFQWSSSGNVAIGNDFDSDLNLHGGWERRNLFENNKVNVPYEHASSRCSVNCGGEGGGGDAGTWWPIYWSAGNKAVKWSGSSGPQNTFFHNVLTKQTKQGGAYELYRPYSMSDGVFQFGSSSSDPSTFQHLAEGGTPLSDWAGNETKTYTGGQGVNHGLNVPATSLFLKHYPRQ
ncbi:hypothetical protein SMD11_2857 [Streptomyces albireticuli]|uniref:SGNH hydrolase-type esterase domain-containing protein n=1 Tax=Streptomyces albireticuli TaxID=1940 RepID=A0A1Z2L2J2_9ACTN|nr:GDSL-type esterase/lipase family protein [Streptomyces albireticuli]ARZ68505.1 hypothetical protein SMD11_2857 [Streptomyces albireticuli]